MNKISNTQKVCGFYVSNIHFATMILPFANRQLEEKTNIITFFENNFTTNIELVLSRLTLSEQRKKEILSINWRDTNNVKYLNIERILKTNLKKQEKNLIIINGTEEYINTVNDGIERYVQKNAKKINCNNFKLMNFFEVR